MLVFFSFLSFPFSDVIVLFPFLSSSSSSSSSFSFFHSPLVFLCVLPFSPAGGMIGYHC